MARVLVVEDSPTQAAEIRFLLEDAGLDVDLASDGHAALASLQEGLPDLVVTDLQMPRMDGLALVEAVRGRIPDRPGRPHHGARQRGDRGARALRCGAASYVPKRDLARDLAQVVHQIVAMAAPTPGGSGSWTASTRRDPDSRCRTTSRSSRR